MIRDEMEKNWDFTVFGCSKAYIQKGWELSRDRE